MLVDQDMNTQHLAPSCSSADASGAESSSELFLLQAAMVSVFYYHTRKVTNAGYELWCVCGELWHGVFRSIFLWKHITKLTWLPGASKATSAPQHGWHCLCLTSLVTMNVYTSQLPRFRNLRSYFSQNVLSSSQGKQFLVTNVSILKFRFFFFKNKNLELGLERWLCG